MVLILTGERDKRSSERFVLFNGKDFNNCILKRKRCLKMKKNH